MRFAVRRDLPSICRVDPTLKSDQSRRDRIREAIEERSCFVVDRTVPVAYAMMDYRFFGRAFVWMIYVALSHRRKGIGTELLTALETRCLSGRIFTSTNASNEPMQALLKKCGYVTSGAVLYLDENDLELFYSKIVKRGLDREIMGE